MLATIIVELLVAFLTALFQKWMDSKLDPQPTMLVASKNKFMNGVWWRFWLGPDRMQVADKAFQASLKRMKETVHYVSKIDTADQFAKYLTDDLVF